MSRKRQRKPLENGARHRPAELQVREQNHDPDEQHAGDRGPVQPEERPGRSVDREQDRCHHPRARHGHGSERHAGAADCRKRSRRVAVARQREQHPRRQIKVRIRARQRRGDHDEVHHAGSVRNADRRERPHERAAGDAAAALADPLPRRHHEDDRDGEHVEHDQSSDHRAHGSRNRSLGMLDLARCDGDDFHAHVARDHQREREPDARPSVRQKTAGAARQVLQPHGGKWSDAGDERKARGDECNDGNHLDDREPVLEFAEAADVRRVYPDEARRHGRHPQPSRRVGKPEAEINRGRGDFGADRKNLNERIRRAHEKPEPWREIAVRVHAERARFRVHDGHLGERVRHDQRNHRADDVGDDHARAGEVDRHRASEKQPDADRAANRDHRDLS